MTNFAEMIKRLEAEIEAIKSISRRTSETLGTMSKTITITPQVHGNRYQEIGGTWVYTAEPDTKAIITLDTGGEANYSGIYFASARNGRTFSETTRGTSDGEYCFEVKVVGNNTDASELGGLASNKKTIPIDVTIVSTSVFDATVTYESV